MKRRHFTLRIGHLASDWWDPAKGALRLQGRRRFALQLVGLFCVWFLGSDVALYDDCGDELLWGPF